MDELNTNEPDDVIKSTPKHYLLGTLGALLGAFIASIPWILMYVYGNMILSALAILVAIGALKGYQIFKGTIDKKLPFIISIISLLVIIITTLVIIPFLLLINDGLSPTMENFQLLYSYEEFSSAIVHDLIVSVLFTILGISGVVANVNKQIKESNGTLNKIKISSTLSNPDANAEASEQDVNTEKSKKRRFGIILGKIIIFIVLVLVVFFTLYWLDDDNKNNTYNSNNIGSNIAKEPVSYTLEEFNMKIEIPTNMNLATESEINTYFGEGSSELYKFAAYNRDDMLSCFTQEFSKKKLDEYYKALKKSFKDDERYTIISDYKKETISGFEFTTIEGQAEIEGILYNDLCLGYFVDNKFILFEYSYPAKNSVQARNTLTEMISKIK